MHRPDLDSEWWCNQWCTFDLAIGQCRAALVRQRPHLRSLWMSRYPTLAPNMLSSMLITNVCKCHSVDWPIGVYLRRPPNLIADSAMDCSWNSVSHPMYYNDTASSQPVLFKSSIENEKKKCKTKKRNSAQNSFGVAQKFSKNFTSVLWITIDLCESNVPVTTKCIASGRSYRHCNCICAEKIDNNVLSGIFATQNGHIWCTTIDR